MNWSITYGTVAKTLADWGVKDLTFRKANQVTDEAAFSMAMARLDDDPIFPEGALLKFYQDATPWFAGHVRPITCAHAGTAASHAYRVACPWIWLENNDYQATWSYYESVGGGPYTLVNGNSTHVLLNLGANGALISTKTMIERVLAFAIARGALLAVGTIDIPTVYLRVTDVRDRACAEIIREQLRPHPDAVVHWDYSVWPPRINIRPASALAAVSLARGVDRISSLSLTPQSDLVRGAVVVRYEKTAVVNGIESRIMVIDRAPAGATGLEDGALNYTINLRGLQVQNAQVELTCTTLPTTDEDWITWIKTKITWLANAQLKNLALVTGTHPTRMGTLTLPNELIKGQVPAWLLVDGVAARTEHDEVKMRLKYDWYTADGVTKLSSMEDQEFVQQFTATDAETGTFSAVTNFTAADPQPVGLAAHEYAVRSVPHYAGQVALTEQECLGNLAMGKRLNLAGYQQAAWGTMGELIQSVTEDVFHGRTTAQFGPPAHLSIPDLVHLILQ